jgi:predicted nuclease with TOPRIM domain
MAKQQGMLNDTDLGKISNLIDARLDLKLDDYSTKQDLKEAISHLPTKDEFYNKMDEVLGEVQKMREDFAAHKMSHEHIEEDTSKLKQQVKHLFTTFEIKDPIEVVPSY